MGVNAARVEPEVAALASVIAGRDLGPDDPLDLDSLGHAELAVAIEEALGVWVPDDASYATPREAARAVGARLARRDRITSPLRPGIGLLQLVGEAVMRPVLERYYRLEVVGADHVPGRGPAVLAANHDSFLDIPALEIASPRLVWFMAKEDLFRPGFGTWFFHSLGAFPVRRALCDLGSIRAALSVVRWGRVLGMYPEGTRTAGLTPFLPGAAWVSLVTGAPLIPVGIRGTAEAMPPGSPVPRRSWVRVAFGEPIRPGPKTDRRARLERARQITVELRAAVERLL